MEYYKNYAIQENPYLYFWNPVKTLRYFIVSERGNSLIEKPLHLKACCLGCRYC